MPEIRIQHIKKSNMQRYSEASKKNGFRKLNDYILWLLTRDTNKTLEGVGANVEKN